MLISVDMDADMSISKKVENCYNHESKTNRHYGDVRIQHYSG